MDDELLILRGAVRKIREMEHPLITIDGPCASGKTTLASRLAEMLDAAVIHTDDFVIPHALKTEERLAVPGGNCDSGRLYREVCAPWRAGLPVLFSRYDCRGDRMLPPEKLPECRALILEGSYCNVPVIRESADVRFFLATAPEIREARLVARESPESLAMFRKRWIPLEDAYFAAFGLPDAGYVVLEEAGSLKPEDLAAMMD